MANARTNPLRRERLSDRVCAKILGRWRSGRLQPGQRLEERTVAREYGISRTPVREAMFQLARLGILVETNRGYVLREDTDTEVKRHLEIRSLLEPAIARHAAADATNAQITQLEKILKQESAAASDSKFDAFMDLAYRFRRQLRLICRNKLLAEVLERLDDRFTGSRITAFHAKANRTVVVVYHKALLKAINKKQPDEAERLTSEYLERLGEYYERKRS